MLPLQLATQPQQRTASLHHQKRGKALDIGGGSGLSVEISEKDTRRFQWGRRTLLGVQIRIVTEPCSMDLDAGCSSLPDDSCQRRAEDGS
jgi:hypothetical protein